jgi:transketolase
MRDAFAAEFYNIVASDPKVSILTGDIGFGVFDQLIADYPDRFLNMGVAEANMMGVAAGLALEGQRPFVYTIIPFLTMRTFEQIRNDVCIQNLPVKIVGVGGGLAYGPMGPTHHSIVDISILRSLPNMTVMSPCDPLESKKVTQAAYQHDGPVYVRLGRNREPVLHTSDYDFKIGRAVEMRTGNEATIVSTGAVTKIALDAATVLADRGVSVRVINMHTVKPIDSDIILQAAAETRVMVSVEEHSVIGGLGSAVAEVLSEGGGNIPFKRIGIPDTFCYGVGSQEFQLERHGVSARSVEESVVMLLEGRPAAMEARL